jgi:hypothetical protein
MRQPVENEKLKALLKTAIVEVLEERQDLLQDAVVDALEEVGMAHWIIDPMAEGNCGRGTDSAREAS